MVIAGKIRGNAPQLANYLLAKGENERITIIDVDGNAHADASYFKDMLYSMELNSELTRSRNSVYHAYINPNPEDTTDRAMSMEEWQQSVDILTKQLGYEHLRKAVVLHEKPNARVHAHIVYERYNHDRGTMATYEDNYKAHDRARAEMEKKLSHKPTPQKNKNHDRHKQTLSQIWQRTQSADEFIREASASCYTIAKGTDRPFRVVDSDGVSFDLLRKLDGVKTKEVKTRFAGTELLSEKEAIKQQQTAKHIRENSEAAKAEPLIQSQPETHPIDPTEEVRQKFQSELKQIRERNRINLRDYTLYILLALRVSFSFKGIAPKETRIERKSVLKEQFSANAFDTTNKQREKTIDFSSAKKIYTPI